MRLRLVFVFSIRSSRMTKPMRSACIIYSKRLARRHGLPLYLKHVRPTFSAVVDALGGHEGLLWLYVLLKLPSAWKLWLAKWKITSHIKDTALRTNIPSNNFDSVGIQAVYSTTMVNARCDRGDIVE